MWENNLPSGDGILVSANGDEYRGSLRNGQREGKGRLDYANGNYYTGPFKNDMCEGHGTLVVIAVRIETCYPSALQCTHISQ